MPSSMATGAHRMYIILSPQAPFCFQVGTLVNIYLSSLTDSAKIDNRTHHQRTAAAIGCTDVDAALAVWLGGMSGRRFQPTSSILITWF